MTLSILPDILGDRNELDAGLAQPPDIELGVEAVAAETAERMDDNKIEGVVRPRCPIDHVLEDGPVIIERRSAGFGEHLCNLPATLLTEPAALGYLIRQGQIGFGLPAGRDANIDGGARHTVSPSPILAVENGADFVMKEGSKQSDLVAGDGKRVGEINIDDIAIDGTTTARRTRTITRLDAGRFFQRRRFIEFMSEPVLHL